MKIHNILILGVLGMVTLHSCQDDEVLDLKDFPINRAEIIMQDGDNLPAKLFASYQSDGTLALNGILARTYIYRFKASSEEIKVNFTPICTNIASDKVQLSTDNITLTPGETDAVVTVSLTDDDFSFAASNFKSEIYELGVAAVAQGYNIVSEPQENKLIIEKEAYQVHASFKCNTSITFNRTLAAGDILESEPMKYTFSVVLDKPAQKDISLSVITEGLDEKYLDLISLIPEQIIIPAGEMSSNEISWTISNDLLKENALPAAFDLVLRLKAYSEDETVQSESANWVAIGINKKVVNVGVVDGVLDSWSEIAKQSCSVSSITGFTSGDAKCLLDGKTSPGTGMVACYTWNLPATIVLDLNDTRIVQGIKLDYSDFYGSPTCANDLTVYTSRDGSKWLEEANVMDLPSTLKHVLRFYNPISTRYVKVQFNSSTNSLLGVTEFTTFE